MNKTVMPEQRNNRLAGRLLPIALSAALLPVYLYGTPEQLPALLQWQCPLLHLTGIPCAGCGMTRALFAFFHGDFAAAFRCHPLFALPLLAWLGLWWCALLLIRNRPLPQPRRWWSWTAGGIAVVICLFWLVRLADLFYGRS